MGNQSEARWKLLEDIRFKTPIVSIYRGVKYFSTKFRPDIGSENCQKKLLEFYEQISVIKELKFSDT